MIQAAVEQTNTGVRFKDFFRHPDVALLEGFKRPKFSKYNGVGDPYHHLLSSFTLFLGSLLLLFNSDVVGLANQFHRRHSVLPSHSTKRSEALQPTLRGCFR